jgi:hypothetical protein
VGSSEHVWQHTQNGGKGKMTNATGRMCTYHSGSALGLTMTRDCSYVWRGQQRIKSCFKATGHFCKGCLGYQKHTRFVFSILMAGRSSVLTRCFRFCCLLFAVCCPLPAVYCLLSTAHFLLHDFCISVDDVVGVLMRIFLSPIVTVFLFEHLHCAFFPFYTTEFKRTSACKSRGCGA